MDIQAPRIDALTLALHKLNDSDKNFALSLLQSFKKYGHLSDNQMIWVGKLTERASRPAQQAIALDGNIGGIFKLFHTAKNAGLRYPKIRLQSERGQYMVLALAGQRSKNEGAVQITDGQPFGNNQYFGRIDPDGKFTAGRALNSDVRAVIDELAADPAKTAAIYGRRTGECCFCGRHLDDARSIEMGYGPVCADRFGVDWGGKKAKVNVSVALQGDAAVATAV